MAITQSPDETAVSEVNVGLVGDTEGDVDGRTSGTAEFDIV